MTDNTGTHKLLYAPSLKCFLAQATTTPAQTAACGSGVAEGDATVIEVRNTAAPFLVQDINGNVTTLTSSAGSRAAQ